MSTRPEPFPAPAPRFGAAHLPGTLGGFAATPTPGCTAPGTAAPAGSRDPLSPAHRLLPTPASAAPGLATLGTRGVSYLRGPRGHQDQRFHPRHQCQHLGALGRAVYQRQKPPPGYGWPERCQRKGQAQDGSWGAKGAPRGSTGDGSSRPGHTDQAARCSLPPGRAQLWPMPLSRHAKTCQRPSASAGIPARAAPPARSPPRLCGGSSPDPGTQRHRESLGAAQALALPCLAPSPCPAS